MCILKTTYILITKSNKSGTRKYTRHAPAFTSYQPSGSFFEKNFFLIMLRGSVCTKIQTFYVFRSVMGRAQTYTHTNIRANMEFLPPAHVTWIRQGYNLEMGMNNFESYWIWSRPREQNNCSRSIVYILDTCMLIALRGNQSYNTTQHTPSLSVDNKYTWHQFLSYGLTITVYVRVSSSLVIYITPHPCWSDHKTDWSTLKCNRLFWTASFGWN